MKMKNTGPEVVVNERLRGYTLADAAEIEDVPLEIVRRLASMGLIKKKKIGRFDTAAIEIASALWHDDRFAEFFRRRPTSIILIKAFRYGYERWHKHYLSKDGSSLSLEEVADDAAQLFGIPLNEELRKGLIKARMRAKVNVLRMGKEKI